MNVPRKKGVLQEELNALDWVLVVEHKGVFGGIPRH